MKINLLHLSKIIGGIAAIGTATLIGLTTTTHAYSDLGANTNIQYVKVKRPLFTGQYTKVNGRKGQKVITPKGTILKVEQTNGKSQAYLTRGAISYQKQQRIYQPSQSVPYTKHYTTQYFTPYKLKLPVRTRALQLGKGYTNNKSGDYKPIFYITLDGYIQYYSTPRLKHYKIQNSQESSTQTRAIDNPTWTIQPTTTEKVNTFKTKGNTSYVYYKKGIKGLPDKKVSSNYYRLAIKKLNAQNKLTHYGDEDWQLATWVTYNVGGHHFYDLTEISSGD